MLKDLKLKTIKIMFKIKSTKCVHTDFGFNISKSKEKGLKGSNNQNNIIY